MAFTYVTVTRDYDLATSAPPTGDVYFTPTQWLVNAGVTIVPATRRAPLDTAGVISIPLAANTDPTTTPLGSRYQVREVITGQPVRTYEVQIPHNIGSLVDLSGLAPGGAGTGYGSSGYGSGGYGI